MLKDFQLKPYAEDLSERENEQLSYFYKEYVSALIIDYFQFIID